MYRKLLFLLGASMTGPVLAFVIRQCSPLGSSSLISAVLVSSLCVMQPAYAQANFGSFSSFGSFGGFGSFGFSFGRFGSFGTFASFSSFGFGNTYASGSGYALRELIFFILMVIIFVFCIVYFTKKLLPLTHEEYISAGSPCKEVMKSGSWKGYYKRSPLSAQYDLGEFCLNFDPNDKYLNGRGVDDVGTYSIAGMYGSGRIAFSKTYQIGSQNAAGQIHPGNTGHSVEYRGELPTGTLSGGFRGVWMIGFAQSGTFQIWPADQAETPSNSAASGLPNLASRPSRDLPNLASRPSEPCVSFGKVMDACFIPCSRQKSA